MQFTLSIKLSGTAFEDDGGYEVGRMLKHVAEQLKDLCADEVLQFSASIHDYLGQCVGVVSVEEPSP